MGSQARSIFEEARALGFGDLDMTSLVMPAEHIAGAEIKRPEGA